MQVKMQLTVENLNISIKREEVVVGKNYYRIVIEKTRLKMKRLVLRKKKSFEITKAKIEN